MQGTATASGSSPAYGSAATLEYAGSSSQTTSNIEFPATWSGTGGIKINNANTLTLNGAKNIGSNPLDIGASVANSVFSDGGFQLTGTGTCTITSGTFKLGSAGTATTYPAFTTNTFSSGATVEYASGAAQTVSNTPSYQNLTFSGNGTKTLSSGTLTVNGNWSVGSTTAGNTNNPTINLSGNFSLTAGTFTSTSGNFSVGGNWSNSSTFTHNSGTVTFNAASGTQTLNSGGSSFNNISHTGAGVLQLITNDLTTAGTFSNAAGAGNFDANGKSHTSTGLASVTAGLYIAGTGTHAFNGGLTLNGGTFSGSTGSVSATNVTLNGGTLSAPSSTFSVTGDWTNNGGTFTPGTGTITLNGTSADQNIKGTATSQTFNNLTVNKSSTKVIIGGSTTAVTVGGTLTMTAGNIDLGTGGTLELGTSASSAGTLSYTAGTIINSTSGGFKRWINATGTAIDFPVGTSSNKYNARATFTALTSGSLTVRFDYGDPGNNSGFPLSENSVTVYSTGQYTEGSWSMIPANSLASTNYALELTGTGFSSAGTFDATVRILKRPDAGGAWTLDGAHAAGSAPTAKRSGLSGFSRFALALPCSNPTTVNAGGPDAVCMTTPTAITLNGASVGGSATTGAWAITSLNPSNGGVNGTLSSTAQTGNPEAVTYTPPANYTGTVTLTLTTNNPVGACQASSATRTISVTALAATSISYGGSPYCSAAGTVNVTLAGETGGTYTSSPSGLSINASTGAVNASASIAGTYTVTYTYGPCNNTTTASVQIITSTNNTTTVSACDSYTWLNTGQTYTSSGTYTGTTTNCITEVLNLTITSSTSNTTTASACDSYTWNVNGTTYTSSGTYTSVSGCHTEVLNLTITSSTSNTTTASACDSYTWSVNGTTYTSSGTYTSVSGCHTEILNLTITSSTSNTTTASACDSYTWSVNGTTYTSSGTYTSVSGCHTEILNLTITLSSITLSKPVLNTGASSQQTNLCDGGDFTYTINPVSDATSYNWVIPQTYTLLSNTGTSVSVSIPAGIGRDSLIVTANNVCTVSDGKIINLFGKPGRPVISGPACVSANQTGIIYSVTNPEAGAPITYTWKVPGRARITAGQGTSSITVDWRTTGGFIMCTPSNTCDAGAKGKLSVSAGCNASAQPGMQNITAYPNPASGLTNVLFTLSKESKCVLELYDMNGRKMMRKELTAPAGRNKIMIDMSKYATGLYTVRLISNDGIEIIKIMKGD